MVKEVMDVQHMRQDQTVAGAPSTHRLTAGATQGRPVLTASLTEGQFHPHQRRCVKQEIRDGVPALGLGSRRRSAKGGAHSPFLPSVGLCKMPKGGGQRCPTQPLAERKWLSVPFSENIITQVWPLSP